MRSKTRNERKWINERQNLRCVSGIVIGKENNTTTTKKHLFKKNYVAMEIKMLCNSTHIIHQTKYTNCSRRNHKVNEWLINYFSYVYYTKRKTFNKWYEAHNKQGLNCKCNHYIKWKNRKLLKKWKQRTNDLVGKKCC